MAQNVMKASEINVANLKFSPPKNSLTVVIKFMLIPIQVIFFMFRHPR